VRTRRCSRRWYRFLASSSSCPNCNHHHTVLHCTSFTCCPLTNLERTKGRRVANRKRCRRQRGSIPPSPPHHHLPTCHISPRAPAYPHLPTPASPPPIPRAPPNPQRVSPPLPLPRHRLTPSPYSAPLQQEEERAHPRSLLRHHPPPSPLERFSELRSVGSSILPHYCTFLRRSFARREWV
jgi:hypothetical protein